MLYKNCRECHKSFRIQRNPNQTYCSDKGCQTARKRRWHKQRTQQDPDYRENQQAASRRWRAKNAGYWRQYRACHPEYVADNRAKQRVRYRRQQAIRLAGSKASLIANSDALRQITYLETGTYALAPIKGSDPGSIANSDALVVQISVISTSSNSGPKNDNNCKEMTL